MPIQVNYAQLEQAIGETIRAASTRLPADVTAALKQAQQNETKPAGRAALDAIVENIELADQLESPICQDTGYPTFYTNIPRTWDKEKVRGLTRRQLAKATAMALLRPNAVDPLSGKNTGDNSGALYPAFYFEENDGDELTVQLLLKGGGSENVSCQYKLPHGPAGAGRDLAGVEKVVLDGIFEAQGFGCGPGIIGVAIGGDRTQSFALAKKQLLRPLDDRSELPELAALEERLVEKANRLGIGAMGFGGETTVLGVKAAYAHRHPASYFVTIAYGCWALRRKTLRFGADGYHIGDVEVQG